MNTIEDFASTQMVRRLKKFGFYYPLPGSPCGYCGCRFDEHNGPAEEGFDKDVCPTHIPGKD